MFDLWYEHVAEGVAGVHCTVDRWTPSVRRAIDTACDQLVAELIEKGYVLAMAVGADHPKFCEYMGGEYKGAVDVNGESYEVYTWELQPQ